MLSPKQICNHWKFFSRDVAAALNTLELLVAEKAIVAAESADAIHSAVALPVDDILNDAVNVMQQSLGQDPEVVQRLQKILRNARYIKKVIQNVGRNMAPGEALPKADYFEQRPHLNNRRVLVVDAEGRCKNRGTRFVRPIWLHCRKQLTTVWKLLR